MGGSRSEFAARLRENEGNRFCWPPSSTFWQHDFVTATGNGLKPYLFKSLLPFEVHDPEQVTRAFQRLQNPDIRGKTGSRMRVYIEEEREDDLVTRALQTDFRCDESLLSFMQRVTGVERFSLVLNNAERISQSLAANLGAFIRSMFLARGVPLGGCEQVVFAGNYSGTAFGVHEGFEHAFLIHLGPGIKDFYCWPQETYLEMTGGSRKPSFGDYTWMLPRGQKFRMEPGDALYLPALVYHVGRQTNFSVAVAIPIYTYPQERFFSRIVIPGLSHVLPFDEEGRSEHLNYSADCNKVITSFSEIAKRTFAAWLNRDLDTVLRYHWYRLMSNGGWELLDKYTYAPFDDPDLGVGIDVRDGDTLSLVRPYRLYWERALHCAADELRVFGHGRSVVVRYSAELEAVLNRLNREQAVTLTNTANFFPALHEISKSEALQSA